MRTLVLVASPAMIAAAGAAKADPIDLTVYAGKDGCINTQKLASAQLANTYRRRAIFLTA